MEHEIEVHERHLQEICSICREQYVKEDKILYLSCTHYFHTKCVIQWFITKSTCPTCRIDQTSYFGFREDASSEDASSEDEGSEDEGSEDEGSEDEGEDVCARVDAVLREAESEDEESEDEDEMEEEREKNLRHILTSELAELLELPLDTMVTRSKVVQLIDQYVEEHDLRIISNRNYIKPDEKLRRFLLSLGYQETTPIVLNTLIEEYLFR